MSEQALREVRTLVRDALAAHPDVAEAWPGGRSTEVDLKTTDGKIATIIVVVKEVI